VGNSRLINVTDFLTVYGRHTERFLSPSLIAIALSSYIFLFFGSIIYFCVSKRNRLIEPEDGFSSIIKWGSRTRQKGMEDV